jgi:hypothetical protein
MFADMIEDIVNEIEARFKIKGVEVDYDFRPASKESVMELIITAIENLEENDYHYVASGETWVVPTKLDDDAYHIDILLLKRGVEIQFILPRTSNQRVIDT